MTDPWAPQPHQPSTPPPPVGEPPTQQLPRQDQSPQNPQYSDAATEQFSPSAYPPPEHHAPAGGTGSGDGGGTPPGRAPFVKRMFRDPLSIVLVVVIVLAVCAAGLVGAELYARNKAGDLVADGVCAVVEDGATASFGGGIFLLQWASDHYDHIVVETAGNQLKVGSESDKNRVIKGMKLNLDLRDVRVSEGSNSDGTIGQANATITWSADGIRDSIAAINLGDFLQDALGAQFGPLFSFFSGAIVIDKVSMNPSQGTIELSGPVGEASIRPKVENGKLSVDVVQATGPLGISVPRELIQDPIDAFIPQLIADYPLGLTIQDLEVTDAGVVTKLSSTNVPIPNVMAGDAAGSCAQYEAA